MREETWCDLTQVEPDLLLALTHLGEQSSIIIDSFLKVGCMWPTSRVKLSKLSSRRRINGSTSASRLIHQQPPLF